MPYQTFPWNVWIETLANGDARPFYGGLRTLARRHRLLRGKSQSDLRKQYGEGIHEEVVQTVFLNLLRRRALDLFLDQAMTDEQIQGYVWQAIFNVLTDTYTKRTAEKDFNFPLGIGSEEEYESDSLNLRSDIEQLGLTTSSSEGTLEAKELLQVVRNKLTKRQQFILHNYRIFDGDKSAAELADLLRVSVKLIELEVSRIRAAFRTANR